MSYFLDAARHGFHSSKRAAAVTVAGLVAGLALTAPTAPAVAAAGPVTTPPTASDTPGMQRALDQLVEDGAPGALLYSYDKGKVTALQSGLADIASGTPMVPGSSYRIGSQTKTYVATAVLQLVAQDRVHLGDPVSRYLPRLLAGHPRITVRQLLNHTSGLYEFNDDPRVLAPYLEGDLGHVWTPRHLVRIALSHKPVARPGTAYHYANTNYVLAGLMVQAVTGRGLGDVLRDRVFSKAHLDATTFTKARTLPSPASHGYVELPGDKQPTDITSLYPYPWASGATVSTAPDVARFYRHLLSGRVLPQRLMAAMRTTVDASGEDGPGTRYGLGLERFRTPCGAAWGHGGNFPGYVTYVYSSPSGGRQTVLMVNEDPSSLPRTFGPVFLRLLNQAYCR
ncbi:MAG: beta-lactamase family protein [Nocardioides sp.]|nr:beta-lactamase family protein [Nocardioides sp.]